MPYEDRLAPVDAAVTELQQEQGATVLMTAPPTASAPTAGLPTDATPGHFYMFASNPSTIYVLGSDNLWRAIALVRVI